MLTYHKGPFQWYWQAQYIGPFNFDNSDTPNSQDILGVSHWWLVNTTFSYYFTKALMRFIVDNVADKEPPYPALSGIGGNLRPPPHSTFPAFSGAPTCWPRSYHF